MIMLIGLSVAVSEKKLDQQVGYDFSGAQFDQVGNPSNSITKVNIKDNSFNPSTLSVPVGETVEWHNQDSVQHTVTSDIQGQFDSGVLNAGKKFSNKFINPGVYGYHCSIHPGMQGKITVTGTSAMQETSISGSKKAGSEGSVSASWSEMPLSSVEKATSADLQSSSASSSTASATQVRSMQLLSNPAIDQSASQLFGQVSGQTSGQASGQDSSLASSQVSLQKFSQYYSSTAQAPKEQLTAPTKIDLKDMEPAMLYFGSTQKAVPYTQYKTYALSTGANSLWISGSSSWTQYAMVPLGSMLNMIATSPVGGYGYLYEIYPDGNLDMNSYYFNPYNQMGFYADEVGQHQLFFNIGGQPSNVIVIDVVSYQPTYPVYNFAAITIRSSWLRGYNVYVDGSYLATEGMTGDPVGTVTINVPGDLYHNIAIDGSGLTFSDYKYFKAGYAYQLNV
jgi:plastocyanin